MTTLDEIYSYVPGGQIPSPEASSTRDIRSASAEWWVIVATPDYNSPQASVPHRDFSPLDNLLADAQIAQGSADRPDSDDDLDLQRENARAFRNSQLNVIGRESD